MVPIRSEDMLQTFYHVTKKENVESILKNGLIPQIGERSKLMDEEEAIFLFPNYHECENALFNWLGEIYEGYEGELVSLEVFLPAKFGQEKVLDWEWLIRKPIPPAYIRFFKNEG